MEEQNILAGNAVRLNQIKSDVKEHNITREKVEAIKLTVKDLEKTIDSAEKAIKDEIESTLKTRSGAVAAGFDTEIENDEDKIKKILADRDKAKSKGMKERIAIETSSLREDNAGMKAEIKEAFKRNKIPKICNTQLFLSIFMTNGFKDIVVCITTFLVLFAAIPSLIYYLVPNLKDWSLIVIYLVIAALVSIIYKLLNDKVKFLHIETIQELQKARTRIHENKCKIKKIIRGIKKDKNEESYGLGKFDEKIDVLRKDIEKIQGKKAIALEDFENSVKPNIVSEIDSKDRARIESLKGERNKSKATMEELENRAKEQRIYIASNYEAYLGADLATPDKLEALSEIMNTGQAETIGKAITIYNTKK